MTEEPHRPPAGPGPESVWQRPEPGAEPPAVQGEPSAAQREPSPEVRPVAPEPVVYPGQPGYPGFPGYPAHGYAPQPQYFPQPHFAGQPQYAGQPHYAGQPQYAGQPYPAGQPHYAAQPQYVPQGYAVQPGYPPAFAAPPGYPAPYPYPPMMVPQAPAPPREGWGRPGRIEPVPETQFAVVHLEVPPVVSGLAIGSLITGIVSLLVSFAVVCFGLLGAEDGWGGWVGGAFALLATIAGAGAVVQGLGAMRQVRGTAEATSIRFSGRGVAIAGLACGGSGAAIALVALLLVILLTLG